MFDVAYVFCCPKVAGVQKDGLLQKLLRSAELIATGQTDALSDDWFGAGWHGLYQGQQKGAFSGLNKLQLCPAYHHQKSFFTHATIMIF